LTRRQSWADLPPPYFLSGVFPWISSSSCPSADPLACHQPILWLAIGRSLWPAGPLSGLNSSDHRRISLTTRSSFNRSITLCFSSTVSPYPFLTVFFQKTVSTTTYHGKSMNS
jgi:hypothetical protein